MMQGNGDHMDREMTSTSRSFKPSLLMGVVLGVHVVAAGAFMMMSGCQTRREVAVEAEPPPAPVMPPQAGVTTPPVVAPPRAPIRPPAPVEAVTDSAGANVYTVQKGDSLSKIAARAGVSVAELAELNKISDRNAIRIGQRLLLPAYAKSLPSAPAPAPSKPASKPAPAAASGPAADSGQTHTVQSGDTLGKLASRYGASVAAFRELNSLKNDVIRIGQKLKVPASSKSAAAVAAAPAPAPEPPPVVETTPVAVEEIAPVLAPPDVSAPPAPVEAAPAAVSAPESTGVSAAAEPPFPYTVREGDTLDSIAIKFSVRKDVIMSLNSLSGEGLNPGQKLLIPWQ